MKKLLALLLAAVMCLSLVACGGGDSTLETAETPTTDTPTTTEYVIGEAFGTDSVECVVTEVRWVTLEDVKSHPELEYSSSGVGYYRVYTEAMFPGYKFPETEQFTTAMSGYPYLCITYTLRNIGKTIIEPVIQDNEVVTYGNISVLYDGGYTFDAVYGFRKTLEVLGDAVKEGRLFEVPSQVYENKDKALKVNITLPTSNGETAEFIVTVR